jgi:hypothetical protein
MFMHYVEAFHPLEVVLWLWRLVADLSPPRPGFDRRPRHVRCVVVKVALGQVLFRALCFSLSVSFHQCSILLDLHVTLTGTKNGQAWDFTNSALEEIGEHWIEKWLLLFSVKRLVLPFHVSVRRHRMFVRFPFSRDVHKLSTVQAWAKYDW